MRILLLSMPDSFEHTPALAIRMPNGALASLAGNVDPHHQVAIADLVLAQSRGAADGRAADARHQPDLVGLSVMTFQRGTARRIIALIRAIAPTVRIVVGGYDPSLAPERLDAPGRSAWTSSCAAKGDLTFRELLRALERRDAAVDGLAGSGSAIGDDVPPQRRRGRSTSIEDGDDPAAEPRGARALAAIPCSAAASTSSKRRGAAPSTAASARSSRCAAATSTASRSSASSTTSRRRGAAARASIFFVDDNITLDVPRFEALCRAIVEAGLNDIDYIVQAMTAPIAAHGDDAGAADAAGGIPLRVPRHRERRSTRTWRS